METLRVLLVEDDEDDYHITRDLLAEIGQTHYTLDWVNNGDEALSRLHVLQNDYDVCLLDYRLGKHSGLEIIRSAIEIGISIPMILLTEHSDREIDLSAMQEGASDFLVKSEINSTNLDRVIRYVCAVKRHEQERLALALAVEERKQAEAANKSKDDFLAMVSHELRGPINAILLWAELLKTQYNEPEMVQKAIEHIDRSIKQQSKILDDLLELTRGLNQMIKLYKHSINLNELVSNTVILLQREAAQKQIHLELKQDDKGLIAEADPDRLQQVFNNLISNSIKFTPEQGHITVNIKRAVIKAKVVAEIRVQDTGVGISAELLPLVFDRYLQAPPHSYNSKSGLGLGLTIARQLVELHAGSIRAESAGLNQGASIIVELPLISADVKTN